MLFTKVQTLMMWTRIDTICDAMYTDKHPHLSPSMICNGNKTMNKTIIVDLNFCNGITNNKNIIIDLNFCNGIKTVKKLSYCHYWREHTVIPRTIGRQCSQNYPKLVDCYTRENSNRYEKYFMGGNQFEVPLMCWKRRNGVW